MDYRESSSLSSSIAYDSGMCWVKARDIWVSETKVICQFTTPHDVSELRTLGPAADLPVPRKSIWKQP